MGLTNGRKSIGADVATAEPTMIGAIWIGAEVRLGVDGVPTSSGEADEGRGCARRFGAGIGPCAQASHSGVRISPGTGLGSLERLRRRLLDARDGWGIGSGLSGNPTWMRRQMRTRATTRSW